MGTVILYIDLAGIVTTVAIYKYTEYIPTIGNPTIAPNIILSIFWAKKYEEPATSVNIPYFNISGIFLSSIDLKSRLNLNSPLEAIWTSKISTIKKFDRTKYKIKFGKLSTLK